MDLKDRIFSKIKEQGPVSVHEIARDFRVTRAYIHKLLKELRSEGQVSVIGKTTRARYVASSQKELVRKSLAQIGKVAFRLKNQGLDEAFVFERIERETGIFLDIPENVHRIVRYAFTEMLNNAIDHSGSDEILVECRRTGSAITFTVRDFGIGVFNNVRQTRRLPNTLAAIQDLLKGKTTTMPERHSGEGIYFTSKAADVFVLDSFEKKLTVNNLLPDLFISDRKELKGTLVTFTIRISSKRDIQDVFRQHTNMEDGGFSFSKTKVHIKLHDFGSEFLSRSEAKRVLVNLEKFEEVDLDFDKVKTVGQAFADEIFRVWHNAHPGIKLVPENMNENVEFMVRRGGG
jgi:anti-sigma regulatory factor (Ser/Thr protein kinase)/DNA-binding MarR family transcriptional regulator